MQKFNFNKTKYGQELLIDLIRLENLEKYIANKKPHKLSYYDITLITKGKGCFYLDEQVIDFESQTVIFTKPMQVRNWKFEEMPHGFVLIFEEEFLATFFNEIEFVEELSYFRITRGRPDLILKNEEYFQIVKVLEYIENEIFLPTPKDYHMLRALLYQALIWLDRFYKKTYVDDEEKVQTHHAFYKLVNRYYSKQHSVSFYANELNISSGHLNDIIKSTNGISAKKAIQKRLFLEAKRLLIYSTLTVSEIAWKLSFEDASYFIRAFKNFSGCTPNQYRTNKNP